MRAPVPLIVLGLAHAIVPADRHVPLPPVRVPPLLRLNPPPIVEAEASERVSDVMLMVVLAFAMRLLTVSVTSVHRASLCRRPSGRS